MCSSRLCQTSLKNGRRKCLMDQNWLSRDHIPYSHFRWPKLTHLIFLHYLVVWWSLMLAYADSSLLLSQGSEMKSLHGFCVLWCKYGYVQIFKLNYLNIQLHFIQIFSSHGNTNPIVYSPLTLCEQLIRNLTQQGHIIQKSFCAEFPNHGMKIVTW